MNVQLTFQRNLVPAFIVTNHDFTIFNGGSLVFEVFELCAHRFKHADSPEDPSHLLLCVYVCMCVCVYVCMCVYMSVYVCACVCVCVRV